MVILHYLQTYSLLVELIRIKVSSYLSNHNTSKTLNKFVKIIFFINYFHIIIARKLVSKIFRYNSESFSFILELDNSSKSIF